MRSRSSALLARDLILDHCGQGPPKQASKGWTGEARFLGNGKDFTWVSARGQGHSPVPCTRPGPPALQHSSGRGSPGVSPCPGQQHSCPEVTTVSPSPEPQSGGSERDLRNYVEPRWEPPASPHPGTMAPETPVSADMVRRAPSPRQEGSAAVGGSEGGAWEPFPPQ